MCIILGVCMVFLLISCDNSEYAPAIQENEQIDAEISTALDKPVENNAECSEVTETSSEPFPGRIAIITNEFAQIVEAYLHAEALQSKYGEDRFIHRVWPVMFAQEVDEMISIMQELATDPELRAVIINQASVNTNAAVDALLAIRNDVFIVYVDAWENATDVALRADLILSLNFPALGYAFAQQAKMMGAQTIVHYSMARQIMNPSRTVTRRNNMREEAERLGMDFVEIIPPPVGGSGTPPNIRFIAQDIPYQVEIFGSDTVFFGTTCGMMPTIITQVLATGAIFVQPCCPSPWHRYPDALGIDAFSPEGENRRWELLMDTRELISEMREVIYAQEMTGRISTSPMTPDLLWMLMGIEYAIRWINNEVDRYVIDLDVLSEIGRDIILGEVGEEVEVTLEMLEVDGRIYPNFILGLMGDIIL
jgi:hypothetical protein